MAPSQSSSSPGRCHSPPTGSWLARATSSSNAGRVYLPDITNLQAYREVKSEFVTGRQPASTAIEVKGLAFPGLMVEVEAIAVL